MKSLETRLHEWKFVIFFIILLSSSHIFAENLSSKVSFTGCACAGARYSALGKAVETLVDDVYAIYWNPAGLCGLSEKWIIKDNGNKGNIEEEDLIIFSEDERSNFFFQIGLSAAKLDNERESGFAGIAFNMLSGVIGIGLYYIQTKENEISTSDGNLDSNSDALGSTGYISIAWELGLYSFGFSIKGLHQEIGDIQYYGGGLDAGCVAEVIPFIKFGFVVQDIGTCIKTKKHYEEVNNSYDLVYPVLKFNASFTSDAYDLIFAIGGIKKIEGRYELHIGIQYNFISHLSIYFGVNDTTLSTGFTYKHQNIAISYAFFSDINDFSYNNILSATYLFN
ncbi:MAG: hypothetical protein SVR08_14555 [Spirochaetota bacterium]|nr:hypothetical protein [Spirochaetota bacterium]